MWDDHTVPKNSDILINFIRLIRSEYHAEDHGPILIHCSAGVGRSGTFIALDRLLQQFDKLSFNDYLDIYGTVFDMRKCRDKMVQNEVRFIQNKYF
jgi:cadherin 5 type 2 (VE-cadherin)